MAKDNFQDLKEAMVSRQIFARGVTAVRILNAFRNTPRHLFVPEDKIDDAYQDRPLAIGEGQTISQPYIVALMTEVAQVKETDKILEVGTGSGYQSAILTSLGAKVYSIERIHSLAERAKEIFKTLNYKVEVKAGDGTLGWKSHAPYDKIIITAAAPRISPLWIEQLKVGGRIIIPLGSGQHQDLTVVEKVSQNEYREKKICGCVFVPLIGEHGHKE